MTLVTKGMGAIIKKFGKKTAKHMADTDTRHKSMKKLGYSGPKYRVLGKKKGETSHKMEEVWTFNPYGKGKKITKGKGKK